MRAGSGGSGREIAIAGGAPRPSRGVPLLRLAPQELLRLLDGGIRNR